MGHQSSRRVEDRYFSAIFFIMDIFDVAVIGAGPAGSMAAKYAAKAGACTILLEEHAGAGWPVQCAGLLGQEAMAESEISSRSIILQSMRGATVFSPGCQRLDFKAKAAKAWVVDRRLFDQVMLARAVAKGAELRIRSNVRKIRRERGNSILTLAGGREIKSKIVISAEGVSARIARQAGISPSQMILSGAQVQVPFAVEDPEKAEVHLGVAPGLFGWVIPLDE